MTEYEEKLRREREWHEHLGFRPGHILNRWPFNSPKRAKMSSHFVRTQFAGQIRVAIEQSGLKDPQILIAPLGAGLDVPYLVPLSKRIAGIDVAPKALEAVTDPSIEKHLGDIRHMDMFPEGRFDIVVMAAFFHHFLGFGFTEFLLEARRVMRRGGYLFALEPNILNPLALAAWAGKKVFGNITGCVEDESRFRPGRLTGAMRQCGFRDVTFWAATYSYHRAPVPLAHLLQAVTPPLRHAPLIKYVAGDAVFYGRKP
jgi:SAM-dependent methyltransferase